MPCASSVSVRLSLAVWLGGLEVFAVLQRYVPRSSFNFPIPSSMYVHFLLSRFPVPLPAFRRCCASHICDQAA
ncbi:hypothetical protein B0H11DRAFT_1949372 [Mycena galericulata]|nr:hypothetical protein B0H11DRAFT_1949372 [Mycena galericulata]